MMDPGCLTLTPRWSTVDQFCQRLYCAQEAGGLHSGDHPWWPIAMGFALVLCIHCCSQIDLSSSTSRWLAERHQNKSRGKIQTQHKYFYILCHLSLSKKLRLYAATNIDLKYSLERKNNATAFSECKWDTLFNRSFGQLTRPSLHYYSGINCPTNLCGGQSQFRRYAKAFCFCQYLTFHSHLQLT